MTLSERFGRADGALHDALVRELAHDRIVLHVWSYCPLTHSEHGETDLEHIESWAGSFSAPLVAPTRSLVELALFESAACGLDAWLAQRDELLKSESSHGSPYATLLIGGAPTAFDVEDGRPSDAVRSLAERLVDCWLAAFDASTARASPLAWTASVLDVPRDGTLATRVVCFDARLAQLLSEPLGALLITLPAESR